ncbi:MAG: ATP-binding protein [Acidobacteria bacterium]|nr:ATP-binding protein [Acidobacteriota bacterium]
MKRFFNVEFAADTIFLKLATDVTISMCRLAGFNDSTAKDISLAVDEAVTNTIKHAYHFDKSRLVTLQFTITQEELIIDVCHTGNPISNTEIHLPDMEEYMKQYRKGGLGIVLMTRIMDSVSFGSNGNHHYCRLVMKRGRRHVG